MKERIKQIFWGLVLGLLAAMWIYGAIYPSPGESPLLFGILGLCATIASSFTLYPKSSLKFFQGLGVGLKWLYFLGMGILVIAGIISLINGAPIPAAIIVGAIIIALAISQSRNEA